MTQSEQQRRQFDTEGCLFLADLFSGEEIAVLRREAEAIFHMDRKEIWRDKSGSASNITAYLRKIVYLTVNAVSNHIRTPTRPEYIAHRDFRPIEPVEDDALLRYARSHRVAAE